MVISVYVTKTDPQEQKVILHGFETAFAKQLFIFLLIWKDPQNAFHHYLNAFEKTDMATKDGYRHQGTFGDLNKCILCLKEECSENKSTNTTVKTHITILLVCACVCACVCVCEGARTGHLGNER